MLKLDLTSGQLWAVTVLSVTVSTVTVSAVTVSSETMYCLLMYRQSMYRLKRLETVFFHNGQEMMMMKMMINEVNTMTTDLRSRGQKDNYDMEKMSLI